MPRKGNRVRKYVSVPEAADCLGCTTRHIYALLGEGHLRGINISVSGASVAQSLRISVESLELFKSGRKVNADEW
jgi:excisionase family DNA binding protein